MSDEFDTDPVETVTSVISPDTSAPIPTQSAPIPVDDWNAERTAIAGGDAGMLKRLSRYTTRVDAIRAGVEAQNKIGSIRVQQPLTADSSPEDVSAYRQAHGIPETSDKYQIQLSDGLIIGDNDQPIVDKFLAVAHKHHLSPGVVNDIISNQLALQDHAIQARAAADRESLSQARAILQNNDVWGSETQLNINMIHGLLDKAPEGVKEQLRAGRMADGTPIFNHPPTLQWLASIAREANPLATVVPGSGSNGMQAVSDRIKKIEDARRTDPDSYWKNPSTQKEYGGLLEAQAAELARQSR